VLSKNKPLSDAELEAYEAERDIGAELVAALKFHLNGK
jgi:hypothetical protein